MEVVQVAIIVMTVLVFFQAVFISALFLISGNRLVRARARIDAASRKLSAFLENGGVLVGRVEEFCQELPAIEEKVVQILSAVRRTTRKSDELAEKSLSFLRDRLERAETESDRLMAQMIETTELVQQAVLSPARYLVGAVGKLRSIFGRFWPRSEKREHFVPSDEEIFI